MRQILYVLAILCAIGFIVAGTASLLLFNIERRAFESSTYKQAFEQQGLYNRMPAILASAVQQMIAQNPNAYSFLKELTIEDWQSTISALLPPEELQVMTDSALDSTFEFVNGRSDTVVISLLPIKAHLGGESGVDMIRRFLQSQPPCTIDQLTQMALGLLGGEVALCNPPDEAIGLFQPFIQSQLQTLSATFPNEVTLTPVTESGTLTDRRTQLHLIRSAVRFSPFFVLLLLLAVAIFAVRSIRDLFVWWGWPLLIAGASSLVIALIASPLVGWLLQYLIQTQIAGLIPPLLASSLGEAATAVAGQMLSPVVWQGIAMAVIGATMIVLGFVLGKRVAYQVA